MIWLLLACSDRTVNSGEAQPTTCDAGSVSPGPTWTSAQLLGTPSQSAEAWDQHPNFAGPGLAVLDANQDGWLDLAIADPRGSARLLLGGPEGFSLGEAVVPQGQALAAGDINGDGHTDLLLARWAGTPDLLGLGDGAGAFLWSELPDTLGQGMGWTLADVDGDGDLDAFSSRHLEMVNDEEAAAGLVQGTGSYLYRNEQGTLVMEPSATPESSHLGLTFMGQWLDADQDGDLDLYLVQDFGASVVPNALLLNDGTGSFVDSLDAAAAASLYAMGAGVGDVDGDGWPDLYVSNIGSPLLLLNLNGTFVDATAARSSQLPPSAQRQSSWGIDLVDLNGDLLPEAALRFGRLIFWMEVPYVEDSNGTQWADANNQADVLLWNDGETLTEGSTFQDTTVGRSVVHGDWDRDGDPDLMTASWDSDGQVVVQQWRTAGGCPDRVTVQAPIGTRVRVDQAAAWVLPATSFSSSAQEVQVWAPDGVVRVTLPGEQEQGHKVKPGDLLDLR